MGKWTDETALHPTQQHTPFSPPPAYFQRLMRFTSALVRKPNIEPPVSGASLSSASASSSTAAAGRLRDGCGVRPGGPRSFASGLVSRPLGTPSWKSPSLGSPPGTKETGLRGVRDDRRRGEAMKRFTESSSTWKGMRERREREKQREVRPGRHRGEGVGDRLCEVQERPVRPLLR